MYFYFYDKLTQDKKYEHLLISVETRLIDLGLNGRVEKLSIFKNAREIIRDAVKKGAKTIVAVGDDKTFTTVVNMVAGQNVILGFIPVEPGVFSKLLGIPVGEAACEVLSKRLYETVDLGCVQDFYFMGAAVGTTTTQTLLRCDDAYTVTIPANTSVTFGSVGDVFNSDAALDTTRDGKLHAQLHTTVAPTGLFRRKGQTYPSIVRARTIAVACPEGDLTLLADRNMTFHTPCNITVAPAALKVIVGRDRLLGVPAA